MAIEGSCTGVTACIFRRLRTISIVLLRRAFSTATSFTDLSECYPNLLSREAKDLGQSALWALFKLEFTTARLNLRYV